MNLFCLYRAWAAEVLVMRRQSTIKRRFWVGSRISWAVLRTPLHLIMPIQKHSGYDEARLDTWSSSTYDEEHAYPWCEASTARRREPMPAILLTGKPGRRGPPMQTFGLSQHGVRVPWGV